MFATSRTTSVVTAVLASLIDAGTVPAAANHCRSASQFDGGLDLLWSQFFVLEIDETLMRLAGDLATTHGLRGYDAVHLAAAHLVRANVFSSADDRLCEAASAHGFHVANPSA